MKTVIFDLDGTLVKLDHRLDYILNEPKQWDKFYEEIENDELLDDMYAIYETFLYAPDVSIIIVTGRSDKYKQQTLDWLEKHGIMFDELYMRKEGDHRRDYEVKKDILDILKQLKYDILCVFEDRDEVVQMYRENGVRCLQVCNGNY